MNEVRTEFTPPLVVENLLSFRDDAIASGYFSNNYRYTFSILVGGSRISYGQSRLYDYYTDICIEIDKLDQRTSHFIEMSGYTVAELTMETEEIASLSIPKAHSVIPVDYEEYKISITDLVDKLKLAKTIIESFVLQGLGSRQD